MKKQKFYCDWVLQVVSLGYGAKIAMEYSYTKYVDRKSCSVFFLIDVFEKDVMGQLQMMLSF